MELDKTNKAKSQSDQEPKREFDTILGVLWWFLQETSLHGCKNIENKKRGVIYRLLWTLMVLCMLGGLLYTLARSYIDFFNYKVIPRMDTDIHHEITFPAITVCSSMSVSNHENKMSQTLKDYFASGTIMAMMFPPISSKHSDEALRELRETTLKDVLNDYSVPESASLVSSYRWSGSGNISFTPVTTYLGKCFTTNNGSASEVKATVEGRMGGLDISLNLNTDAAILTGDMTVGAMIFVHDPHEKARTLQDGVMVGPGSGSFINIKPTKYDFQPFPYKSYGNTYCKVTPKNYSYEACVDEWAASQSSFHCNCSGLLATAQVQEKLPPCSLKQHSDCFLAANGYFLRITLMSNFSACPRPCSFTKYEMSVSSSVYPSPPALPVIVQFVSRYANINMTAEQVRQSTARVFIYIERFIVNHVIYEPAVTLNGIFSQLGGQMGFFLGASLLTVCELGEALLRLGWAVLRALTGRRVRRRTNTS